MTYFNLDLGGGKQAKSTGEPTSEPSCADLSKRLGARASTELDLPLCATCSTQTTYKGNDLDIASDDSEYKCRICLDPRQYIGRNGQKWTSLRKIIETPNGRLYNDFEELVPGSLWTFKTRPAFGIGQRAFLIKEAGTKGLVMWDCVAYLDDATLQVIDDISGGEGIAHMVVSHPHYYSTTATWLAAFPSMTLWLAGVDFQDWYPRRELVGGAEATDAALAGRIKLVHDEQTQVDAQGNVTILLLGGHFPGSLVLLWNKILFIADTIQVVPSGLYKSDEPQRPGVASVTFLWR